MAITKRHSSRYDYTCLSSDTKPTARVLPSSVAIETDTHDEYLFNGVSWGVRRTPVYPKMWNAGTLAYDAMTQPLVSTDTLSVNADVTDDATRDLGKVDVASLDQYTPVSGRLPVDPSGVTSPIKIEDKYGWVVEATPMDELRVINPVRLAGATFVGTTVDTNFWTVTNANGGTTTQASGAVTLKTNTTLNGSTILQSVRKGRYTGGSANRFRAQVELGDVGVSGNVRRWGCFDGTDGAYYKLSGTTLYACTMLE